MLFVVVSVLIPFAVAECSRIERRVGSFRALNNLSIAFRYLDNNLNTNFVNTIIKTVKTINRVFRHAEFLTRRKMSRRCGATNSIGF